jgi:hypothetical protein
MRYYFDIRDGTGLYPDEQGRDFPDQRRAESEAAHILAGVAHDLAALDDRADVAVEVRTQHGPAFQAAFVFETNKIKH